MATHFIFTVKGLYPKIEVAEVLEARFSEGRWPLGTGTAFQKQLQEGDQVLFYVAGRGPGSQHVLALGEIEGPTVRSRQPLGISSKWLGIVAPTVRFVPIRKTAFLERPVGVKPLVNDLSFIRNKDHWGSYFQGGIVKIPESDFRILLSSSLES